MLRITSLELFNLKGLKVNKLFLQTQWPSYNNFKAKISINQFKTISFILDQIQCKI